MILICTHSSRYAEGLLKPRVADYRGADQRGHFHDGTEFTIATITEPHDVERFQGVELDAIESVGMPNFDAIRRLYPQVRP